MSMGPWPSRRERRRLLWWMGWVVVGVGVTIAVLLPARSGCSITNEFDCGSAVPLIRIAVLALTGILATFLAFVGSGPR